MKSVRVSHHIHIIDSKHQTAFARGSATIESFTLSTWSRTRFISSRLGIDERSIDFNVLDPRLACR
jgi:hypothetical protein